MRRKKIIKAPKGAVEKLAKEYKFTTTAVYNALAYKSDSEAAKAIRKDAVEYYGAVETSKIVF